MGRDASLDDFLGGGQPEEDDDGESTPNVETASDAEPDTDEKLVPDTDEKLVPDTDEKPALEADETDVDPATSTSSWTAEGATCEACGETVSRRWREDDRLVCEECKSW